MRESLRELTNFPYGYHAGALAFHILLALPAIFILASWTSTKVPQIQTSIEIAIEKMPPSEVKEFVGTVYRRTMESSARFGLFSLAMYLLTALGFASSVHRSIQAAAPGLVRQQAILTRALLLTGGFLCITLFYFVSAGLAQFIPVLSRSAEGKLLTAAGNIVLFWAGYLTLLKCRPLSSALLLVAVANGLLVSLCQAFFSWYLTAMGRLLSIYGAVSSLLVLSLWVYVVAITFLVGARLLELSFPAD